MKVEAITLREIHMPLVHFFETSFGRTTERRILLLTVHTDGPEGWGECVAGEDPFYSEESIDTAWYAVEKYLAPAFLGKGVKNGAEAPAMMARVRGHRMAKGALENALWDAQAQAAHAPLWKLLGGSQQEIPCGVSIGIQNSHEQLLEKIETELAAGYRRIKVKCKPGWDVEVFGKIRDRWSDILLSCDANSAYTLAQIDHLKKFDRFNLLMIEQPLWHDDFYFHAQLQKKLKTSICLDEAIHNARDAQAAIELGACKIINIKVGRVGGFSEAVAVHNAAQEKGIPVWCGGMLETGIGRAHNIALSTLKNFTLPGDVSASKRYWKEDIIEPAVEVSAQGMITIPQSAGRGFKIRTDLIEKLTVRKQTLRAGASSAAD
ncbi:MAG TPA: o-succinylbenzoate synthase [Candidatus Angelobacter sp.]|nr:o-succinylbenzoate synthase [Candidatus Angelobacter sp.]